MRDEPKSPLIERQIDEKRIKLNYQGIWLRNNCSAAVAVTPIVTTASDQDCLHPHAPGISIGGPMVGECEPQHDANEASDEQQYHLGWHEGDHKDAQSHTFEHNIQEHPKPKLVGSDMTNAHSPLLHREET